MRVHMRRVALMCLVITTLYISMTTLLQELQMFGSESVPQDRNFIAQPYKTNTIGLKQWSAKDEEVMNLWPNKFKPHDDRIINQMRFIPNAGGYKNNNVLFAHSAEHEIKVIFVPAGLGEIPPGRKKFKEDQCPVDRCILTDDYSYSISADATLFQNEYISNVYRHPGQIWIIWLLESPFNTGDLTDLRNYINWTATYRADSTIVTPYEKFVHFDNYTSLPVKPERNYALGKKKLVGWFVSNCVSQNKRFEYAQELSNHISVDIYGACGVHKCSRTHRTQCEDMLRKDYKFYLSFENSNCVHYITEKFFWNALFVDVVPIVMGARREDYEAVAPPNSFIHVEDFESPQHLAEYLHKLDQNDELYNNYFRWKGTGYFLNTKFWCRLCSMVHASDVSMTSRWYDDVEGWWRNNDTCVYDRWDEPDGRVTDWRSIVF